MADPVEALLLDLLEWIGRAPRTYGEVMEAWRTSCPRLPVWEEANDRGLVIRSEEQVSLTERGHAFVRTQRHG